MKNFLKKTFLPIIIGLLILGSVSAARKLFNWSSDDTIAKRILFTATGTGLANPVLDINSGGNIIAYGPLLDGSGNAFITGGYVSGVYLLISNSGTYFNANSGTYFNLYSGNYFNTNIIGALSGYITGGVLSGYMLLSGNQTVIGNTTMNGQLSANTSLIGNYWGMQSDSILSVVTNGTEYLAKFYGPNTSKGIHVYSKSGSYFNRTNGNGPTTFFEREAGSYGPTNNMIEIVREQQYLGPNVGDILVIKESSGGTASISPTSTNFLRITDINGNNLFKTTISGSYGQMYDLSGNAYSTGVGGLTGNYLPLSGGTLSGIANYLSDYSGSYTNRSLVDKGYVAIAFSGALSNYANLYNNNTFTGTQTIEGLLGWATLIQKGSTTGDFTINWASGNFQSIVIDSGTYTNPLKMTFTNALVGEYTLKLIQGQTTTGMVDWNENTYINFKDGIRPFLSTQTGAVDIIKLFYDGANWYGYTLYIDML